ncbi:unnamed protein product [Tilletia controversa]|nr:unnamed protein product [Tilletia controversa]
MPNTPPPPAPVPASYPSIAQDAVNGILSPPRQAQHPPGVLPDITSHDDDDDGHHHHSHHPHASTSQAASTSASAANDPKERNGGGGSKPSGRAQRACVNCRKQKMRCIGADDSRLCNRCRTHNLECLFEKAPKEVAANQQRELTEAVFDRLNNMERDIAHTKALVLAIASHLGVRRPPSPAPVDFYDTSPSDAAAAAAAAAAVAEAVTSHSSSSRVPQKRSRQSTARSIEENDMDLVDVPHDDDPASSLAVANLFSQQLVAASRSSASPAPVPSSGPASKRARVG